MMTLLVSMALATSAVPAASSSWQASLWPAPVSGHALVYSPKLEGVLLVGNEQPTPLRLQKWDGKAWSAVPASEYWPRSLAALATDSDTGDVLMHGGALGTARSGGQVDWRVNAETWRFDGSSWTKVSDSEPRARDHHAFAYDSGRKRFVMFGGSDADPSGRTEIFGDTWEFDGKEWKRVSEAGPSARAHHAMAYDPLRKQTILVGGAAPRGIENATWAWDGIAWKQVASGGPSSLSSPRMAFHPELGGILLFGGDRGRDLSSTTWLWNGREWSALTEGGPQGRTVHGMAYDAKRKVMVLFGGYASESLNDLWEFIAGKWVRRRPTASEVSLGNEGRLR